MLRVVQITDLTSVILKITYLKSCSLKVLKINGNSLLSVTAKYMVAAHAVLKSLYPKLLHVSCKAHLLHNGAKNVKSHFEHDDQQIAKVISATVENKTRQARFITVGCLPQLLLHNGEAGQMLPHITQRIYLKLKRLWKVLKGLIF